MAVNSTKLEKSGSKGGLSKAIHGLKLELKRITWPSKKETKKALIAVAVVTVVYVIMVGGFDYIFQNLFEAILKLK